MAYTGVLGAHILRFQFRLRYVYIKYRLKRERQNSGACGNALCA